MGRNTYPGLSGPDARKAIERDNQADARFDEREAGRIKSREQVRERVNRHIALEKARVKGIQARDKADREAEEARELAEINVSEGVSASVADTVIGPTEEWKQHGDFSTHIPRQHKDTTKVIKTVKREKCQSARKQMLAGVIDYQGYMACCWYEDLHEETGLKGSVRSTDFSKEVHGGATNSLLFTERQVDAQTVFRIVRQAIPHKHLRLLDKMVLEGIPLNRAVRAARAFHRRPQPEFARAVGYLIDAREDLKAS